MKVNKIFIDEVQWEDDENPQHGAALWFKIDDMQFFANYFYLEDISLKWIEVELGFWEMDEMTLDIILHKNIKNEKNVLAVKYKYGTLYQFYGQIISVNPLTIDCGKLILVGSEFHRGPIKELEYPEYVGKYVYYETIRLTVRSYKVIETKTNNFLSKISIRHLIGFVYSLFGRR